MGSEDLDFLLARDAEAWVDLTGNGDCTPLWHGRAQLDTINVEGSTGRIEGLTLRLYNPKTHEWRLYWANSKDGLMPPQIGQFMTGHGEFYAQDTLDDKSILVKFDWSALTSTSPHFEQSFSNDGGKNWEVNWITGIGNINTLAAAALRPSSGSGVEQDGEGRRDSRADGCARAEVRVLRRCLR